MDDLINILNLAGSRPIGTLVWLGAGGGYLDAAGLASLAAKRIILVEGDREAAADLQLASAAVEDAEVVLSAVAPAAGTLDWHRYNLPALAGPLDYLPLRNHYPRLRLESRETVQAEALAALLTRLAVTADTTRRNVLVFDLPGQECALVESLGTDVLMSFDDLLVRGCRETLPPPGRAAHEVIDLLRNRYCEIVTSDTGKSPLWPLMQWKSDASRFRIEKLEGKLRSARHSLGARDRQVAELEAALTTARAEAAQSQARADAMAQRLLAIEAAHAAEQRRATELLTQANKAAHDRLAAQEALQSQTDFVTSLQSQLRAVIDELAQGKQALAAHAKDAEAARLQESDRASAALAGERAHWQQELAARIEALTAAHAAQTAEADAQIADLMTRLHAAESAAARLAAQVEGLSGQRDMLATRARDAAIERDQALQRLATSERELGRLGDEIERRSTRQDLLQEELLKAEGQLELVKDLLLGDSGL